MRPRIAIPCLLLCFAWSPGHAIAQDAASPRFDVASVKAAGPEHDGPAIYRTDAERIMFERAPLLRLLNIAYSLDWDQISGPSWLATEFYQVDVKVPPGATKEQIKIMWQNLLAERFNLKVHVMVKSLPVFELTVAKGGAKLQKTGTSPEKPEPGFPVLAPGVRHRLASAPPRNVLQTFRGYSMAELAANLAWTVSDVGQSGYVGFFSPGRVVDKTGLDGGYDFTLEFAGRFQSGAYPPPLPEGETDTAPDLFGALRQQLGLELREKTEPFDVIVVDHVDRVPTEN